MSEELTFAEKKALQATNLEAFPVQLHEIRRTVKQILSLFGRNNFFLNTQFIATIMFTLCLKT